VRAGSPHALPVSVPDSPILHSARAKIACSQRHVSNQCASSWWGKGKMHASGTASSLQVDMGDAYARLEDDSEVQGENPLSPQRNKPTWCSW
jgi:predicted HD phosphohydrolase